jgi:thiol-disulfide isomerase/thioredoxin
MTEKPKSASSFRRWISTTAVFALIAIPASIATYEVAGFIANGALSPSPIEFVPIDTSGQTVAAYEFSFPNRPGTLPYLTFVDSDQKQLSLADFRGRPVLLNIWATWCVPCRKEMPSLDRLQSMFDPSKFLVLTLSIDHQGIPAVRKFYDDLGLKSLGLYADLSASATNRLRLPGVPGTLLIDAQGQEIGRKVGPTEWDSPATVAMLRQHLGLDAGVTKSGNPL